MSKTCIVIQGQTTYAKEISAAFSRICKDITVIWSTWEGEPAAQLDVISGHGLHLLLNSVPHERGTWNCNLQCTSTFAGISYAETIDQFEHVIKIWSDFLPGNVELLVDKFELAFRNAPDKLVFLGYATAENGFLLDYIVGGSVANMKAFFEPQDDKECGLPFPERFLTFRYFGMNRSFSEVKDRVSFANLAGVKLRWLKQNTDLKWYATFIVLFYPGANFVRCLIWFKLKLQRIAEKSSAYLKKI